MGHTIFPGDEGSQTISLPLSAADLEKAHTALKEKFPETSLTGFMPVIVGCIVYRFLGEQHQTGFILQLDRTDPSNPNISLTLDRKQGDIPVTLLRLTDYYVGSAIVD